MSGQELLQTLDALLADRRWDDAVSIATAALAGNPQDARLYLSLAAAHLGAGRSADALSAADSALRLAPAWEHAERLRAQALAGLGRQPEAPAPSPVALQPDAQNPRALEELASQQLARGRLDDAEITANELVRIAPAWAESYNTRGAVLLKRRKLEEAEGDFRAALRLSPDEPVYMNNLGLALHRRGKKKEAIEVFQNAAIRDPSFATARSNLLLSTRVYLWGGGLVLLLSIALHAVYISIRGDTNGGIELQLLVGVLAIIAPVLVVRYWVRRRSLDPTAQTLYDAEARRVRFRPSTRTIVRVGGFLILVGGFVAGLLTNRLQLAALSLVLAILWLHRGWTIWRYASRLFER